MAACRQGGGALFTDVETKLAGAGEPPADANQTITCSLSMVSYRPQQAGRQQAADAGLAARLCLDPGCVLAAAQAHEERVRSSQPDETAAAASPAEASVPGRVLNRIHTSDREQLEVEANKAMKKLGSSKDFMESHLMRASVLTPLADDPPPPSSSGETTGSGSGNRGGGGRLLTTIQSGEMTASADMAKAVVANGGSGSTGEEEEEEHHAAGMGATAVSVVVRGNRVVVANTGACAAAMAL